MEHHELSIYAATAQGAAAYAYPTPAAGPAPNQAPGRSSGPVVESQAASLPSRQPEPCPICGSQEMLRLADAIAATKMTANSLKAGLEAGIYHLHCSRAGEWWVCGQSLQAN